MPLHSFATSMAMPGNVRTKPSRNTGMPRKEKNRYESAVDSDCKKTTTESMTLAGNGSINKSKENGNLADLKALVPKKQIKAPATIKSTPTNFNIAKK